MCMCIHVYMYGESFFLNLLKIKEKKNNIYKTKTEKINCQSCDTGKSENSTNSHEGINN